MKRTRHTRKLLAALIAIALAPCAQAAPFVYQGTLSDRGQPANGRYDLQLQLYRSANGLDPIGAPITVPGVEVAQGQFKVEALLPGNLGASDAYVSVGVRDAGAKAGYTTVAEREKVALATETIGACWSTSGDAGSDATVNFIGTTDLQPFVIKVANQRVGLFAPATDATNVVLGWNGNTIGLGSRASTIGGGGGVGLFENSSNLIGTGVEYGTIAGGRKNTVLDGSDNITIGGGDTNLAGGTGSTIAGGASNVVRSFFSTVGGGVGNQALASNAAVPGGTGNIAGGVSSFAAGTGARVRSPDNVGLGPFSGDSNGDEGSFVWADYSNQSGFTSTGPNQFLLRATGGVGINTATMGAAATLNGGELILRNGGDNNADFVMLTAQNRGFRMTTVPNGTGASIFQIAELDARTASPGNTAVLQINAAGDTLVKGGAVGVLSDRRLKKNIGAIDGALERMLGLRGHVFEYLDPKASMSEPGMRMGFVAQEVAEVVPEWVHEHEGFYLVKPAGFEALAVEAMRELHAHTRAADAVQATRIAALESERDTQRAQVAALGERLERLAQQNAQLQALVQSLAAGADDALAAAR